MSSDFDPFTGERIIDSYEEYAYDDDYWEEDDEESKVICGVCGNHVSPSIVVYLDRKGALHRARHNIYDWDEPPWIHPELEQMQRKGYELSIKSSFPRSGRLPSLICCDYCQENGRLDSLIKNYIEFI